MDSDFMRLLQPVLAAMTSCNTQLTLNVPVDLPGLLAAMFETANLLPADKLDLVLQAPYLVTLLDDIDEFMGQLETQVGKTKEVKNVRVMAQMMRRNWCPVAVLSST